MRVRCGRKGRAIHITSLSTSEGKLYDIFTGIEKYGRPLTLKRRSRIPQSDLRTKVLTIVHWLASNRRLTVPPLRCLRAAES